MSFKNRLMSKIPASYILHKSSNKTEAKLIVKGYNAIRKNNLFDDEFYLNKYPKVKASGMDPLLHYIFFGFNEGKKPNKDFDGVFYKYHYDDVEINPLIHYALYGIDERARRVISRSLSGGYMPVFRCRAERPGGVQKLSDQFGGTKPLSAIYESGSRHASCRLESAVWRYLLLLRSIYPDS